MRIALMTNNYKPFMGGVPISIERLAKGLNALGHQVTIFAPTYQEQQEEEGVFRYATCMKHFIGGIVLPNPFDHRIEKKFIENSYDIIHVHHPMLIGRTAVYLSKKYNVPLVFTYHTRYEQYLSCYTGAIFKWEKITPLYLHTFLKHCHFVFAPTPGMAEYLNGVCNVPHEKIGILPTGIEQDNFKVSNKKCKEIRKQCQAENIPLLLTVSRMTHEKNIEFLLESLAQVKKLYGRPFRVLMVGDGPDINSLKERCMQLGLMDFVMFKGSVPNREIAPYFKAADGFIFASKTETQGIVILEAFAGATPVIALKASGVEDIVENGVNGILTEENIEEYAEKLTVFLNNLHENTSENLIMAQNAYQTASLYHQEAVALRAVHYYNNVIAEKVTQKKRNTWLLPERI